MSGRIATVQQQESFEYGCGDAASDADSSASVRVRPLRSQLLGLCLCTFYAALLISGLTLLGLSAWMLGLRLWTCPVFAAYYSPLWLFLASGILLLVSGVLGLLYVSCHQQQLQQATAALLVLLVLSLCGLFGTLVLSAKYGNDAQARDTAQEVQSLFIQAKLDYMASLNSGSVGHNAAIGPTASNVLLCWDSIQSTFACCGAESYHDWYSYRNGTVYYDWLPVPSAPTSNVATVGVTAAVNTSSSNTTASPGANRTGAASGGSSGGFSSLSTQVESILIAPISCSCSSWQQQRLQNANDNSSAGCALVRGPMLNTGGQPPPYLLHGQGCIRPVKFSVRQHMTVMTAAAPVVAALIVAHFAFACLLPRLSNQPGSRCIYAVNTGPHPTAYIAQTNKRYDATAFAATVAVARHPSNDTHQWQARNEAF